MLTSCKGDDDPVLKLRPGIAGLASLKYWLENEMTSAYVAECQASGDSRDTQTIAEEYNDTIIYPDKVRLDLYYLRHYSFWIDIKMIFVTLFGKEIEYAEDMK